MSARRTNLPFAFRILVATALVASPFTTARATTAPAADHAPGAVPSEPAQARAGATADTTVAPSPNAPGAGVQPRLSSADGAGASESFHDAARSRQIPAGDAPAGTVQVVVYKSKRTLALYRDGIFGKEYRIVLGLQPDGPKRHEHDARTPEGLYRVVGKRPHERWQHFLALDYPNAHDRRAYAAAVLAGTIPDEDGAPFGIGGAIGIHGSDREEEQAAGDDWTKGCIAMSPADVAELDAAVPVGTMVWIVK